MRAGAVHPADSKNKEIIMRTWFSLIILLYTFLSWLVGRQIQDLLRINPIAFWVIFILLAGSPFLRFTGLFGGPFTIFVEKIGYLWMVFFYYAIAVAVLGLLIKNKPFIIGCYVLIIVVILIGSVNQNKIKLETYELNIPKKASDLQVVMLSDLHINKTKRSDYVEKMVRDINVLNPDLVILPGDIFDDRDINTLKKEQEHLKNIKARYGVYGVLGNHEYYNGNLNESMRLLQEAKIRILRDEVVEVAGVYLVGREDVSRKRKDLSDLLQSVDREKPIILIDHQPVALDEAKNSGVDLQLSGHTHRGQFFPNQFITRKIFEVDHGYLAKESLQVVVSSGYGTWGPPVRIGTQSEIVKINLKFNGARH